MQNKYEISGILSKDCSTIILDNPSVMSRTLFNWALKPLHVVITRFDESRTLQQNKYFHAVICGIVGDFLQETQGKKFTTDQIKLFIYIEVLGAEFTSIEINGKEYYELTIKRSHQWGKKEFSEKKEAIQKFFAELDWEIPDPNPNYYPELKHLVR